MDQQTDQQKAAPQAAADVDGQDAGGPRPAEDPHVEAAAAAMAQVIAAADAKLDAAVNSVLDGFAAAKHGSRSATVDNIAAMDPWQDIFWCNVTERIEARLAQQPALRTRRVRVQFKVNVMPRTVDVTWDYDK